MQIQASSPPASPLTPRRSAVGEGAKRGFDLLGALLLLFLFAPLLVVLCIAIRLSSPGPILFRQRRVGRDGQPFGCLKFRTMVPDAEALLERHLAADPAAREEWAEHQKLRNDPRVTRIGHFLRRSSLDELPQLFNVVTGEMSLVGPRPIVQAEVARYGEKLIHYLAVRPGMTGLWQVSGRSDTTYRQRVLLDAQYAQERSMGLDLRILLSTVAIVFTQNGSY